MLTFNNPPFFQELARIFSEENNALAQRELLVREGTARFADTVGENDHHLQKVLQKHSENSRVRPKSELLMIMIATRFFDSIVGNNQFQSISGSIHHNSMIMTWYDDPTFQLDHDSGVD